MTAFLPTFRDRLEPAAAVLLAVVLVPVLVAPAAADEVRVTPSPERTFRNPLPTQPNERRLREVQLMTSTDQGRTWRQGATATPEQGYFQQFTTPQDGMYWF